MSDRIEWLAERRKAVGASEVAAILGLNPYASAWDVWAEKRGIVEDWSGNEATELGNRFESIVLDVAEQRMGQLIRNHRVKHPSLPIASTCDAVSWNTEEPIEAKTAGLVGPLVGEWGPEGSDIVPESYLVQVHTQLLCLPDASMGYLFALIAGRGVVKYEIPRSDANCEYIGNIVSDWWHKHVINGVEPSRELASFEVVKRLRKVPNKTIAMPDEIDALIDRREVLKRIVSKRNEQLDETNKSLLLHLGDAEEGTLPSGRSISYFEQHTRGYMVNPKSYRVLRVKQPRRNK